ncbi:MAG TPA: prolyl oligopeptidase family serine peptidase [Gemmatimonadaceae bacterium]|nr:prolyl oligopeptidase family serine peptidase [Gemmatimonadaceae bacterium]
MRHRASPLVLLLALALARVAGAQSTAASSAPPPDSAADPYLWLEDQYGARSMAWVNAENAKTTAVLEKDPRFAPLYRDALAVAQSRDRIPHARFLGGQLYNFWQDSAHVRGIWRRTSLASYRSASPKWTTVLDLDSLARAEKANWVWEGAECAEPAERRCMISLSDGGEDAVTVREFDLGTRAFVAGGFVLPHGKQRLAWMGSDTLLVSREWNPGELTTSGYPYIVKRLVRGQPVSSAAEIFRGTAQDGGYGVSPATLVDGSGHRAVLILRPLSTFEAETYVVRPDSVAKLAMPLKAQPAAMVQGQLVVQLSEPWGDVGAGSLVSFDAARAAADPAHLAPVAIFSPGPRESVGSVSATRDRLVASVYENVRGRVVRFARGANGAWTHARLPFPDNLSTDVIDADAHGENAFVNVSGFLTPSSVWLVNARSGSAVSIKSQRPQFDASRDTVEQLEAASSDGTKIPYFVVHPKGMKLDGSNATILNAYGGFEVSMTPGYNAMLGKLWLSRGGVYVLANIRGGGEFGPAWHEAGLKTHRQLIYDDFAAVGRDLIARKITDQQHLGIMGGSNGGLLMGVQMTQHPELWHAVDIQVPLLDMLRFEHIDAGSSWVGEYGSVSNADERAFLASISPYNNLKAGVKYPEPLIWTTTKDDRVGPQHARKFAAKMGAMGYPYLFYEVTEGGHGAGANLKERAHTSALEFTYFARQLMGRPMS